MFTQMDIDFIPRIMDSRSTNNFAIASDGQIVYFSQKREHRRASIEDVLEDLHKQSQRRGSTGEKLAGNTTAQSSSEDPSILNSSSKNRHRPDLTPSRSTRSSTGTPPLAAPSGPVTALERSLKIMDKHQFSQSSALGYVDGLLDETAFKYLARNLPIPEVPPEDTECDLHLILSNSLNSSATHADDMGKWRLAQSLRILATVLERELEWRADRGLQHRMQNPIAAEPNDAASETYIQSQHNTQAIVDDGIDDLVRQMVELATTPGFVAEDSTHTDDDADSSIPNTTEEHHFGSSSEQPIVRFEEFQDSRLNNEAVDEKMTVEQLASSRKYILSDFVPTDEDTSPWSFACLFNKLIDYHLLKLHDAQIPAYLLLWYGRWTNHQYSYERAVQIFSTYHERLRRHELYVQAAEIRKFAGAEYPEIAEYGRHGITSGGPWCMNCDKALKGDNPDFCERCQQPTGICPMCENQGPFTRLDAEGRCERDPTAPTKLWTWCQDCGHGGHISCMTLWWSLDCSEGACPTRGCLCDCQPGTRRDEIMRELEKKRGQTKDGVITADEWEAPESAAAHRARRLVNAGGSGLTGGGKGALGLAFVERFGNVGKRVRIVIPEEEMEEGEGMGKGKGKEKEVEEEMVEETKDAAKEEKEEEKEKDKAQDAPGKGEYGEGPSASTLNA